MHHYDKTRLFSLDIFSEKILSTLAQFEKMNSKVVIFALAICLFVTASGGKSVFFLDLLHNTQNSAF